MKRNKQGMKSKKRPGDKRKDLQTAKGRSSIHSLHELTNRKMSYTIMGLEDFPEREAARIDLNTVAGAEHSNDERENMYFITPTDGRKETRTELDLLSGLGTPMPLVTKESPHTMVPIDVLNNIITNQQSLVSLVTGLQTQVRESGTVGINHRVPDPEALVKHQDDAPVTQGELRRLLQAGRGNTTIMLDPEPPLAKEILATPYPSGYQPPAFRKFDGTSSAREHLMCFLDDLGIHRNNKELRLKEFSKSLSGRAFTWYVKLRPHSIRKWEELASEFCGKFLEEEGALHIMDLGRVKQKLGEGLVAFIKRYRDRALQSDVVEAMKRQGKRPKDADSTYDVCALEERERKKNFRSNQPPKRFTSATSDLPPLPINRQQVCQLIEEWLKDGTIQPRVNRPHLSKEQYDDPSYCVLHRTQGHTTTECWTIRRAFHRQVRAGKVLLPEKDKEVNDLHLRPLPEHGVNVIASSNGRIHVEEIDEEDDTEERALALGLRGEAQQEATRALVGLIKIHGGELGAANAPLTRLARLHASAIIFREPTLQGLEFCHNKPLYVEASIEGLKVRRALVDNGSRVNILPSYLFRMLNIPRHRLRTSYITLSMFHGEPMEAQGCVNVVLEVGPIRTVNTFQIVEGDPSYHLLLGRPWIHLHQCIPSTLHQCVKSNFRGREIEIQGVRVSFEATESHLIDAALFDELAPPGSSYLDVERTVTLGARREVNKSRGTTRPTEGVKRPRGVKMGGLEKEYLLNGEVRWRIL
ncbi:Retrotransposon gag domain [Sesbania bispinosa]|nr:Retrotransposon gag domain [Sesbania bispinosa]